MGYYTKYSLSVIRGVMDLDVEKKIATELSKSLGYDNEYEYFDDLLDESMKWYGHDKDMMSISSKYPEYTFLLQGEGEETGDLWRKYRNGMSHTITAKVVFDPFDEGIFRDKILDKMIK